MSLSAVDLLRAAREDQQALTIGMRAEASDDLPGIQAPVLPEDRQVLHVSVLRRRWHKRRYLPHSSRQPCLCLQLLTGLVSVTFEPTHGGQAGVSDMPSPSLCWDGGRCWRAGE